MLAVLKLLASLSEAIPALKDILRDVAGMLTEWNAGRRLRDKDEAVDISINDITNRMRDAQLRKRSKDNEPR